MQLVIYEETSGAIVSLMKTTAWPQGMPEDFSPEGCGHTVLDDETEVSITGHHFVNGVLSDKPVDLEPIKVARWATAKAFRDQVIDGGCPTPLGVVQTDNESRLKISGAVQMAMLAQMGGQPFEVRWTMKDNSAVAHNASQTITLGLKVGKHVNEAFEAATGVRALIDAASSIEDLEAIDIQAAGWPPNS